MSGSNKRAVPVGDQSDNTVSYRLRYVSQKKRARSASAKISHRNSVGEVVATGNKRAKPLEEEVERRRHGDLDGEEETHDGTSHEDEQPSHGSASSSSTLAPSKFAAELELAAMKNGSDEFANLYRAVWPLVRSLPELLHNLGTVVKLLLSSLVTTTTTTTVLPATNSAEEDEDSGDEIEEADDHGGNDDDDVEVDDDDDDDDDDEERDGVLLESEAEGGGGGGGTDTAATTATASATNTNTTETVRGFNLATIDALHLLAALADDARHEIHPHLHSSLLPCLLGDVLQVLMQQNRPSSGSRHNVVPSSSDADDVTIAEATFRTVAYLFRYDAALLLSETTTTPETSESGRRKRRRKPQATLERLRPYYGATLAHPKNFVRRLAAETFAALVRQLPSQEALQIHLSRVFKAYAAQAAAHEEAVLAATEGPPGTGAVSVRQRRRLLDDAADGISHLLWSVAKGVAGKLHSTAGSVALDVVLGGIVVVVATPTTTQVQVAPPAVQFELATRFFHHMCRHLAHPAAAVQDDLDNGMTARNRVVVSVFRAVRRRATQCYDSIAAATGEGNAAAAEAAASSLSCYLNLFQQVLDFRSGILVRGAFENSGDRYHEDDGESDRDHDHDRDGTLSSSMGDVVDELLALSGRVLDGLSGSASVSSIPREAKWLNSCRSSVVRLLCSIWVAAAASKSRRSRSVEATIRSHITRTLIPPPQGGLDVAEVLSMGKIVVQDLLGRLPDGGSAMEAVGSILLSAAARCVQGASTSSSKARSIVMSVALSTRALRCRSSSSSSSHRVDSDLFVDWSLAKHAVLATDDRQRLIRSFISTDLPDLGSVEASAWSEWAERAVCAAFCFLTKTADASESAAGPGLSDDECLKWLMKLLEFKEYRRLCDGKLQVNDSSRRLAAFMSVVLECSAVVALVVFPRDLSTRKDSRPRTTLSSLQGMTERHLLSFPKMHSAVKSAAVAAQVLRRFDIVVASKPDEVFDALIPNLLGENHFLRLHSLEILAVLPSRPYVVDHADLDPLLDLDDEPETRAPTQTSDRATLNGMSDVLNTLLRIESTGLSILEERSLLSLIGRVEVLGRSGRLPVVHAEVAASHMLGLLYCKFAPVWPAAVQAIVALLKGHESCVWPWVQRRLVLLSVRDPDHGVVPRPAEVLESDGFFESFVAWSTMGYTSLFQDDLDSAKANGHVSRHEAADSISVFESSWAIVEKAPRLLILHSKVLVPLLIRFMQFQFFGGSLDDPDARELNLLSHLNGSGSSYASIERRGSQRGLVAMLKALSAVKGPRQLYKSSVMRSVYSSLLTHPDSTVAQLAFTCLRRFGDPALLSYAECMDKLLMKGKLRDALLQIKVVADSDSCASRHQSLLIPTLSRILFGRLSSRAGSKSSKDSPEARRNAILSFLNAFCDRDDKLYPFMYLMLRGYIPRDESLVPVELHTDTAKVDETLNQVSRVSQDHIKMAPPALHEGFLNLLGSVIDQLGFRLTRYVPAFASIVVAIAQVYRSRAGEAPDVERIDAAGDAGHSDVHGTASGRRGAIRALCFKRLADILERFHASIDFPSFASDLWLSIQAHVGLLPEMASNSRHVPALLRFVTTLGAQRPYVQFLESHNVITESVFRCISGTACPAVISRVFTFIEALLGTDDIVGTGPHLVEQNIDVLLAQFHARLESSCPPGAGGPRFKQPGANQTWKHELKILSRVSGLLGSDLSGKAIGDTSISLCRVLLPFLERRRMGEVEQLRVLEILGSITKYVRADDAPEYFARLSKLLGLDGKARPRIESKEVRVAVVSAIESTVRAAYQIGNPCLELSRSLCSINAKSVDELDYDKVLEAIGTLSESEQWTRLATCQISECEDPFVLLPAVHLCFSHVFDLDGVVARSSVNALKSLTKASAERCMFNSGTSTYAAKKWQAFFQGSVISTAREGLRSRDEGIRRFFVQIMREVSFQCHASSSPHFYGDLSQLVRQDDHDLDFFLNITHVQIHRRARALQRLRKALGGDSVLSAHSLSNVLLPLVIHPIYESKSKSDESLALESIATVGLIAKFLSFGKYNALLMTTLSQLSRNPEQERYIVALLCAVIDAFPFDARGGELCDDSVAAVETAVRRSVEMRIIPKVESFLIKEKVDRQGAKTKTLRPSVALALLKLCQKLPESSFRLKLPRLLSSVCGILKNRESDVREGARLALAKMASSMDLVYLPDVIRELALTLNEGYRLHVRAATIHSILLELESHPASEEAISNERRVAFGRSVPGLMDLLQQDLFGTAQERNDADGNQVRFVKEAHGSKSVHSFELIALLVHFHADPSSVRALVSPLLERLRGLDVGSAAIRKVRECLTRMVSGFTRNPTVKLSQVVDLVVASISPFTHESTVAPDFDDQASDGDDVDPLKPISVSGESATQRSNCGEQSTLSTPAVSEWRPSALNALRDEKSARRQKGLDEANRSKVLDGRSAPKLTGSGRSTTTSAEKTVNTPAKVTAVVFGLQLLSAALKKPSGATTVDLTAKLDQLVPLVISCVCVAKDPDVVVLSLKCLDQLLRFYHLSLPSGASMLGERCLLLMTAPGAASNQHQELLQSSFKFLALLLDQERGRIRGTTAKVKDEPQVLTEEQTRVVIAFLRSTILESEQPTAAMKLIDSIVASRFLSPEMYDLMETLLEQTVRSARPALRQQCSSTFVSYLLTFPLSEERMEQHLKQVILNLQFEHADGRLASISLLSTIIEKFPLPLLEQRSQQFFLPLTLVLVNDVSEECRQSASLTLAALLHRLPYECSGGLCDIVLRWMGEEGESLRRTGLQLCGILIRTCPDALKRRDLCPRLFDAVEASMMSDRQVSWELSYFALIAIEKAAENHTFRQLLDERHDLWTGAVRCLRHSHPWVRLVALRVLAHHVASLDLTLTSDVYDTAFFAQRPGSMFETVRGLCHQVGLDESEVDEEAVLLAIKILSLVLPIIDRRPSVCIDQAMSVDVSTESRDPVLWIFRRLSFVAKQKGTRRRRGVFKCFAAFAASSMDVVAKHLELVLEPLHRCIVEAQNEMDSDNAFSKKTSLVSHKHQAEIIENSQLANDVLQLLEDSCAGSPEVFLRAYAAVKSRAKAKKEERKLGVKAQAVRDPQASADRRGRKQDRERGRRKRRIEESRRGRGAPGVAEHVP